MQKKSTGSVRVFYPSWTQKELVEKLRADLSELSEEFPIIRAVLFGSWAKGNYTVASDIDLLIIYADPPQEDAYKIVRKKLAFAQLELHIYSQSEYRQNKKTIDKMIKDGVLIWQADQSL